MNDLNTKNNHVKAKMTSGIVQNLQRMQDQVMLDDWHYNVSWEVNLETWSKTTEVD